MSIVQRRCGILGRRELTPRWGGHGELTCTSPRSEADLPASSLSPSPMWREMYNLGPGEGSPSVTQVSSLHMSLSICGTSGVLSCSWASTLPSVKRGSHKVSSSLRWLAPGHTCPGELRSKDPTGCGCGISVPRRTVTR